MNKHLVDIKMSREVIYFIEETKAHKLVQTVAREYHKRNSRTQEQAWFDACDAVTLYLTAYSFCGSDSESRTSTLLERFGNKGTEEAFQYLADEIIVYTNAARGLNPPSSLYPTKYQKVN